MANWMCAWNKAGVAALVVALGSGVAVAQGSSQFSTHDKMFLKKATMGSNFEIKTGQLTESNASSNDVKQFGQWMVQQHTMLNNQMAPIAQQAGITPPTGLSSKDQAEYNKLASMHGTAFDKAYIKTMVKDHKMDLKEFKTEAADGKNQDEKQAATKGAGVIQTHLDKITQIAQAHHISTGSGM